MADRPTPFPADGYRFALNPIQWFATDDGWLDSAKGPAPEVLLQEIRRSGFPGVHAQLPAGTTVADYRAMLARADLLPAPGYFSMPLPEQGVAAAETYDTVRLAAAQQAALGLGDMFIACRMAKDAARVKTPAVGAAADRGRLDLIVEMIGKASEIMAGEGVRAALHPHVGTWIETEAEARHVLDAVGGATLGFGPDTGHLAWAGADVAGLIRDYRDRVRVMHIKDCRLDVRDQSKAAGRTYQQTVMAGLWAEPGLGDLDLAGMVAALGDGFDGWLIAEVDCPTMAPFDCAEVSARWLAALKRPGRAH